MRVACLDCETRYEIPDDLVDPSGQKVECCRCGLVFGVRATTAAAAAPVAAPVQKSSLGALFWALAALFVALVGVYFAKPSFIYKASAPDFSIEGKASGSYYTRPDGKTLFVVSGKVKNNSGAAAKPPKINVKALGAGIEATAFSYAGSIPSRDALDETQVEKLAASLEKEGGETIAAGVQKDFMVIFANPPKGFSEFEVEISGR